jgi:hypothetical protein
MIQPEAVMREDMGKVLVERPRLGRWNGDSRPGKGYANKLRQHFVAGNSPPAREGMKRRHNRTKSFNEHLGPLRRFLDANVGRPWDKVYSEICKHVDRGNVVQKHILTHLFDYVATSVVLIDGEPCRGKAYAGQYGEPLRRNHYRHQWYVCPKSGLLRKSKYVPRDWRAKPVPPRTVQLNNKQVCVERGARWELITVTMIAHPSSEPPAYDLILQRHIAGPAARGDTETVESHGLNRFRVSRHLLSRRELLALPIPIEWLK